MSGHKVLVEGELCEMAVAQDRATTGALNLRAMRHATMRHVSHAAMRHAARTNITAECNGTLLYKLIY